MSESKERKQSDATKIEMFAEESDDRMVFGMMLSEALHDLWQQKSLFDLLSVNKLDIGDSVASFEKRKF